MYIRPEGGRGIDQKQTKTNRGAWAFTIGNFFCSRWLYLTHFYTLFLPSYEQLFAFCLVVSFFIYVYLSTFLSTFLEKRGGGGGGGGYQNKKFSVPTGEERGVQKRTRANRGGGGGGSQKSNLLLNAPYKQVW